MTPSTRPGPALADSSVFIALEQSRTSPEPLPEAVAVSVITAGELRLSLLVADGTTRAIRLRTLSRVEGLEPLTVTVQQLEIKAVIPPNEMSSLLDRLPRAA